MTVRIRLNNNDLQNANEILNRRIGNEKRNNQQIISDVLLHSDTLMQEDYQEHYKLDLIVQSNLRLEVLHIQKRMEHYYSEFKILYTIVQLLIIEQLKQHGDLEEMLRNEFSFYSYIKDSYDNNN